MTMLSVPTSMILENVQQQCLTKRANIFIKQFRIPEAQRQAVETHVEEFLKLGVIRPSRSNITVQFLLSKRKMEDSELSKI